MLLKHLAAKQAHLLLVASNFIQQQRQHVQFRNSKAPGSRSKPVTSQSSAVASQTYSFKLKRTYTVIQIQFQTQREASKHNKRGRMSHGCTLDEIDYIFNLHHAMMHKSLSRPRVSLLHFPICTEAEHIEHVQIQIQLVVCL